MVEALANFEVVKEPQYDKFCQPSDADAHRTIISATVTFLNQRILFIFSLGVKYQRMQLF